MKQKSNGKRLVSVIMPTYNHARFIGDAIKSVLSQTYDNLELIVIDNYSEDSTDMLVSSFNDERIKLFHFHNKGVIAASRNYGVSQSKGDVLAFIDSDDAWSCDKLEIQLEHLLVEGIYCIASDFIPIGDVLCCKKDLLFAHGEKYKDLTYKELIATNYVATSSLITRRDFFHEVGGFDENPAFVCIEDWELWLRMSRRGKVRVLSKPLILYRIHNKPGRDRREERMRTLKILEKHRALGYLNEKTFKSAEGNCCVYIAKAFLDVNDRRGIEYYKKGLFYSRGFHNKIRAILGLILFAIPKPARVILINMLYRMDAFLFNCIPRLSSIPLFRNSDY